MQDSYLCEMNMKKNLIIYIGLCLLFCVPATAQISHGGRPLPFALSATKSASEELFVQMQEFDLQEQLRLDSLETTGLRNGFRFAYKFMTDYTPDNSGIRFTLPDGTRVWRLGIRSEGALSLNVLFSRYHLPEGARLFLYNRDQTEILGSFTHLNNSDTEILPIAPILGDELIIEYQEPAHAAFPGKLAVGEVNHGYRHFRTYTPKPESPQYQCIPAVACYQDTTERYNDIERSVVLLVINGITGCTGMLLNNSAGDGRPYILTASHCLNEQFQLKNPDYVKIADNIVCYFNYNSPQCSPVEPGPVDQTVSSAYSRAVNEKTDMALLELKQRPPTDYAVYYAGWNAADAGNPPYACIHHPAGTPKRITVTENKPEFVTYRISVIDFDKDAHWKIGPWKSGFTAGGSSGSPLFDGNNRVIGGLTGGDKDYPTCQSPGSDLFFAIQKCWSSPRDSSRQLQCWLDPVGLPSPVCEGMDPNRSITANDPVQAITPSEVELSVDSRRQMIRIGFTVPVNEASLTLIALDGKIIGYYPINSQQAIIECVDIPSGVYIAKIVYNNNLYTRKLLF